MPEKKESLLQHTFVFGGAAGCAGVFERIAVHPLDVIFSSMQSSSKKLFETLRYVKTTNGFKGFYTGLGAWAPASFFQRFSYVGVYDVTKANLAHRFPSTNSFAIQLIAGSVCAFTDSFFSAAADYIKTAKINKIPFTVHSVWRFHYLPFSLRLQSAATIMVKNGPVNPATLISIDYLKQHLQQASYQEKYAGAIAGFTAAALMQFIAAPLDTVKTIHLKNLANYYANPKKFYRPTILGAFKIMHQEKLTFARGILFMRMARQGFGYAIMFALKPFFTKELNTLIDHSGRHNVNFFSPLITTTSSNNKGVAPPFKP